MAIKIFSIVLFLTISSSAEASRGCLREKEFELALKENYPNSETNFIMETACTNFLNANRTKPTPPDQWKCHPTCDSYAKLTMVGIMEFIKKGTAKSDNLFYKKFYEKCFTRKDIMALDMFMVHEVCYLVPRRECLIPCSDYDNVTAYIRELKKSLRGKRALPLAFATSAVSEILSKWTHVHLMTNSTRN